MRRRTESLHSRSTTKIGGAAGVSSARNAMVNGRGNDLSSVTMRTTMNELNERTAPLICRAASPLLDDNPQTLDRLGVRGRTMSQRVSSGSFLLRLM